MSLLIGKYNPAMVALAREARGWTQKRLAEAIGVSQATICKYELGSVEPSETEVSLIAKALGFSDRFYYQNDQVFALGSSLIFHRKRVRVPIKMQRKVQAEINIRRMQIARLLRAVEHDHAFPSIPPEAVGDNPERAARQVREMWGIKDGPIHDLTSVVENAGGIVLLMNFGSKLIDGAHLWISGMPPIFFMNKDVPGERYRFSLAHEVGHAVMHHSSALEDVEEQAHVFAAEMLMPRAIIRSDLRGINLESAARLKKVWKVSMQAIIVRANRLQLISESTTRRLFSQVGERGYRVNEPWPIPLEKPNTFDALIRFHKSDLGISEAELVQDVLFTRLLTVFENQPELRITQDTG